MARLRRIDGQRAEVVVVVLVTVAACLVIWALRRPDQLRHPYVWAEEYLVVNRYQDFGPVSAALHPYVGYFMWPTSFSLSLATFLSFEHLPALDYVLCTLWFLVTVLLVLVPASTVDLRWRAGMALALVLVPGEPEVFGVLLFVFWWATMWPLITLLWSKDHWALRTVVLAVGGMSSLAGALFVVPYVVSYAISRRRRDLLGVVVLSACLVPQAIAYLTSARADAGLDAGAIVLQVLRNASFYALAWVPDVQTSFLAFSGAAVLVAAAAMAGQGMARSGHRRELAVLLVALLLVHIVASAPAPLLTHPIVGGSRYYFLPFAVTSWALLLVIMASPLPWARTTAVVLLCLAGLTLSQGFSRQHDPVDWSAQLDRCRTEEPPFFVPVHVAEAEAEMWGAHLVMSPAMCDRLGHGQ
ncbi:MAG: hypothetical protein GEV08_19605 [Acidimicrobiia bacterium]|nr:hypothetical protein [Acidimicrobiia bacterium]